MGKFSRTWAMMGASWRVLKQDKELLLFPVLSSIAALLVLASFAAPLVFNEGARHYLDSADKQDPLLYGISFLFYFLNYFVIIFFNSALMACVFKRMDGDNPTLGDGLRAAWQRLPQIFGWALLTSSVGFLLRVLEERVPMVGRIVIALLGMAWTVTSYLVVPVVVAEGKGPIAAYKSSVQLLKRSWGEQIIGNVSFGLIFVLLGILPVGLVMLVALTGSGVAIGTAIALSAVYLIALALVQSTLQTIYNAAIYRYAVDGSAPSGFDTDSLSQSFRRK